MIESRTLFHIQKLFGRESLTKQIIRFLTQLVVSNPDQSFAYLHPFFRPIIHKYPENAWNTIPAEMEPKNLYSVLYNSFMVKKKDMNETIEGMENKWALLGEPFEIMSLRGG